MPPLTPGVRLKLACWCLPTAAALLVCTDAGALPQTMEIGVFENVAIGNTAQAVLHRAYERLGITMKAEPLPLRRSLRLANAGELDGDLMRTPATLKAQEQLIMIRVPVAHIVMSAYKLGSCPARVSIQDLQGKRVAFVRGTRLLETLIPVPAQLATANTGDSFRHLRRGIADYAIADEMESDALVSLKKMAGVCKVAEPVAVTDLFHSINKRHADLVQPLEHTLKEMHDSGEIARIWAAEARKSREAILAAP